MRSSGPARFRCSKTISGSGSSPWSVAIRPRAALDGRFVWWPRKPSSGDWFQRSEEKRSAFYSSTTTSNRGGKKMWCVAELNEDYITKMEDVLEVYQRTYDPQQPVVCLDEKGHAARRRGSTFCGCPWA